MEGMVLVDDRIADSIFQQIQTRPQEYSILATLNLNGDYISDAAQRWWEDWAWHRGPTSEKQAAIFEATPMACRPPSTQDWIASIPGR